jgi:uncharacterized SAM-binding protein YcdF (DUF218 family)
MFVLKKIVSGMFMPLPLVLELLVAGIVLLWFTRRQVLGKIVVTAAMFLLLFEGFGVFSDIVLDKLESMYRPVDIREVREARVKWVVVLAGGHTVDGRLPVTSQLAQETQVRLIEGIRIFRALPESMLLVSGGGVFSPVSSAELMARLAADLGVDPKRIVVENMSRDTGEEADLIRPMVREEPFVLVTSAYHMPRSMALFEARGMRPVAAPTCHYSLYPDSVSPREFFPEARKIRTAEIVVHEVLGLIALQLSGPRS